MFLARKVLILFVLAIFSSSIYSQKLDSLFLTHIAGDLTVTMFNEGSIGTHSRGSGGLPGITWKGENALWFGGLIFGTKERAKVNGMVASFRWIDGTEQFVKDIKFVKSEFASGFSSNADFNQISKATLNDSGAVQPYGVEILQQTYSNTSDKFVFIRYGYINKTAKTLKDFYAGIFIDWDVLPVSGENLGGFDENTNLVYMNNKVDTTKYFGIACLNTLTGYRISDLNPATDLQGRQELFKFLSVKGTNITTPAEYRAYQGVKIGDIVPNDTVWATFAVVAGDNLNDIKANATAAKAKATTVGFLNIVGVKNEDIIPNKFYVEQNYPNPFNPTTQISFGLARKTNVDLRVYDMLGREVAVLINNELLSAGSYTTSFEATNLASGTYIYTLKTNNQVISKKMLLLK
jgi:hypothetical protein